MPNVQAVLREEIQRIAKREARSAVESTRKTTAKQRSEIAELKRAVDRLQKQVAFLESREAKRLEAGPAVKAPAKDTRFSVRSLKAQRAKTGLSQADYGKLVGVSSASIHNWEAGTTRPGKKHLASLVALRGIGRREAKRRLELLAGG